MPVRGERKKKKKGRVTENKMEMEGGGEASTQRSWGPQGNEARLLSPRSPIVNARVLTLLRAHPR